jgi:hypothetical protein
MAAFGAVFERFVSMGYDVKCFEVSFELLPKYGEYDDVMLVHFTLSGDFLWEVHVTPEGSQMVASPARQLCGKSMTYAVTKDGRVVSGRPQK